MERSFRNIPHHVMAILAATAARTCHRSISHTADPIGPVLERVSLACDDAQLGKLAAFSKPLRKQLVAVRIYRRYCRIPQGFTIGFLSRLLLSTGRPAAEMTASVLTFTITMFRVGTPCRAVGDQHKEESRGGQTA